MALVVQEEASRVGGILKRKKKRIAQLTLRNEELRQEDIAWEGTPEWIQDNYEWEAHQKPHSGHKREAEFYKNLEEIKQIEINQHMGIFDEPIEGSSKKGWTDFIPFLN